jgi:tetratricopeptide (TPR) repeat protein
MAYAELPTGERTVNLSRAVASYREAIALFPPDRFPVEHGRIQTALAAALRELGEPAEADRAVTRAVELLAGAGAPADLGAALNNLGLARSDLGRHGEAEEAIRRAIGIFEANGDHRQRLTAMHNLGQVQAAAGDHARAVTTYEEALTTADPEAFPFHWAMLEHSRGVSLTALGRPASAVEAFRSSLRVFTRHRYPFRYALAKNNLGLALAQVGDALSLRLAVGAYEDALAVLDPRLHREQWRQVYRNLELAERALWDLGEGGGRAEHFSRAAAALPEEERIALLRERLGRVFELPEPRRTEALAELDLAALRLPERDAAGLTAAWLRVLMELPDELLTVGLRARFAALAHLDGEARTRGEEILDRTIQQELLAPQRVRVRTILERMGWERPGT